MKPLDPVPTAGKPAVRSAYFRPMRLAEILDRSMRLSVPLFKQLWLLFGILATLQVAQELPMLEDHPIALILVAVSVGLLTWYLLLLGPVMAVEYWNGNPVTREQVAHRITFRLAWKFIEMGFRIMFACFFGFLLLIVPGIVMMLRRSLAMYVLLIEDVPPKEAIAKSVHLMSQGKWNSLSSPLMRVSGIGLLLWIMNMAVAAVLGGAVLAGAYNSIGVIAMGTLIFAAAFVAQFVSCCGYLCYAGLYCDLMARYEGADIVGDLDKFTQPGLAATQKNTLTQDYEPASPA